jgi:hypothetical protein
MRLARYFGGDARSWLNLQTAFDLRVAQISHAKRIAREISPAFATGWSLDCSAKIRVFAQGMSNAEVTCSSGDRPWQRLKLFLLDQYLA